MFIVLAIVCLRILGAASASCYNIHNALISNSDYQPCDNTAGSVSMCCGTNRGSRSAAPPDTCLQNGLCQNIATDQKSGKSSTSYWREGCSDKTWNDPHCLKGICTSDVDVNSNGEMSPCDGTATSAKWCCGTSRACCGSGKEILLAAVLGGSDAKASSTTTPTAAAPPPAPAPTTSISVAAANLASTTIAALIPQSPVAAAQSQGATTSIQGTVIAQGQQPTSGIQSNSASQISQAQSEPSAPGATQVTAQGISHLETSQQATFGSPSSKTVKSQTTHTANDIISEASTTSTISRESPGPSSIAATSSGLSTAAKAGIGISVAILAIMVIAAVVFFCTRRSSRHDVTEIVAYRPETKSYSIPAPIYPVAQAARAARGEVRQVVRIRDKDGRLLSPTGSEVRG